MDESERHDPTQQEATSTTAPGWEVGAPASSFAPATDDADALLLLRYAAGDASAFTRLYDRHERPVFRFLLRSLGNAGVAEDLHQEIWMSVIRGAASFQPQARFTTWLYRIARNRLIDHWRAADPDVMRSLDEAANEGSEDTLGDSLPAERSSQPEVRIEDREQARRYVAAVEALPAAQREAFLLHVQAGLSLQQVSALTGAGAETFKSRLRYASARLRASVQSGSSA